MCLLRFEEKAGGFDGIFPEAPQVLGVPNVPHRTVIGLQEFGLVLGRDYSQCLLQATLKRVSDEELAGVVFLRKNLRV